MERPKNLSELEPVQRTWRRRPEASENGIQVAVRLVVGVVVLCLLCLIPWERFGLPLPGDWGAIIGGLHPVIHYLPVAFFLAAVVLQWADWAHPSLGMEQAVCRLLAWTWVTALLTLITGVLLSWGDDADTEVITWHRVGGVAFTVISIWVWSMKRSMVLLGRADRAWSCYGLLAVALPVMIAAGFTGYIIHANPAEVRPLRYLWPHIAPDPEVTSEVEAASHLDAQRIQELKNKWPGMYLGPIQKDRAELSLWRNKRDVTFGDEDLKDLLPLAHRIRWMDLSRTSVTDDGLAAMSSMTGLVRLKLRETKITDAGLVHLAGLSNLEFIDASGTAVGNEGFGTLVNLPGLKRLMLWQTAATAEGILPFAESRPDLIVSMGWKQDEELRQARQRKDLGDAGFAGAVTNELMLYLPFDKSLDDAVMNRAHNTRNARPAYLPGHAGAALDLAVDTSVIYGPDPVFERTRPVTVTFWLKAHSTNGVIVSQRTNEEAWRGAALGVNEQRLIWSHFAHAPDDGIVLRARRPLALDTWHHVALVYDGSSRASGVRMFVDGRPELVDILLDQWSGEIRSLRPFVVGAAGNEPAVRARLDDLRIHSRVLHPDTISYLAELPVP